MTVCTWRKYLQTQAVSCNVSNRNSPELKQNHFRENHTEESPVCVQRIQDVKQIQKQKRLKRLRYKLNGSQCKIEPVLAIEIAIAVILSNSHQLWFREFSLLPVHINRTAKEIVMHMAKMQIQHYMAVTSKGN